MARKCNNETNYQGVSQLKGLPGSATIKRTAKEYHNQINFREYYNKKDCNIQNDCQGVPQSTEMSMSVSTKIKMTARVYHNQKEYQGVSVSQIKMTAMEYNKIVLSGSITIQTTAREHSK